MENKESMRRTNSSELISDQRYALVSVSDKTGIVGLARAIDTLGIRIISSSGTARSLTQEGIPVTPVEEITEFPECFGGRIKTIHPKIEGGILYRRDNLTDVEEAEKLKVPQIDIVVCNLYPFEKTIEKPNVTLDMAIENIDVGGPAMIRSAAKNYKDVLVVIDPNDYPEVIKRLITSKVTAEFRQRLAAKAFDHSSLYDSLIASFLREEVFPDELTIPLRKVKSLRYGDNPHQEAVLYVRADQKNKLASNLESLSGRELSQTNLTDIDAGYKTIQLFKTPAAVVVKHNSPCGISLGKNIAEALSRAIEADPESAFGGVVVINRMMDRKASLVIAAFKKERQSMMDIIAAPDFDEKAKEVLETVRKTTGIYSFGKINNLSEKDLYLKEIDGGFGIQTSGGNPEKSFKNWKIVSEKKPTKKQIDQMRIGWKFISRIKSNTVIVVDKNLPMTRGIGSGQTSRFRSTEIALKQAGKYAKGAILASDSFFPFDDSVKLAAKYGISAIVQQGGSINDKASIEAANKSGVSMVFTGRRAFWH